MAAILVLVGLLGSGAFAQPALAVPNSQCNNGNGFYGDDVF